MSDRFEMYPGGTRGEPLFETSTGRTSTISVVRFLCINLRLMLGVVFTVTALTTVLVYVTPYVYVAKGVVLVERGKSPTLRSDPLVYQLEMPEVMHSEIGIIESRTVAEGVIDRLDLENRPQKNTLSRRMKEGLMEFLDTMGLAVKVDRRTRLLRMLDKKVKVKQEANSSLLAITFGSKDPEFATEVTRAVMDSYLERHREIYADRSSAFFEQRVRETEAQLEDVRGLMAKETDAAVLDGLSLQRSALMATYRFYSDKWNRSKADHAADVSLVNVRPVDYPVIPKKPVISRLFRILLAFVGSTILAVAVALAWEYFDHTVYAPGDIRVHAELPVVASVRRVASVPPVRESGS